MEKDKLYKQASLAAYNYATHDGDEPCLDMDFYEGFKQGAEWLQSQPIADRLTEEEREKIINLYNMYNDKYWANNEEESYGAQLVCNVFEQIFGKEMFENKN